MGDGTGFVSCWREGSEVLEGGEGVNVNLTGGGSEKEMGSREGEREGCNGVAARREDVGLRVSSRGKEGERAEPGRVAVLNTSKDATPSLPDLPSGAQNKESEEPTHFKTTAASPPVVLSILITSPTPPPPLAFTFPFPFPTTTASSSSPPSSPLLLSNNRTANTSFPAEAQKARSMGSKASEVGGAGRW